MTHFVGLVVLFLPLAHSFTGLLVMVMVISRFVCISMLIIFYEGKMLTVIMSCRESNPECLRGRQAIYHCTTQSHSKNIGKEVKLIVLLPPFQETT